MQPATHEGSPCQRVSVRFERAGLKSLSTAVAELRQVVANSSLGPSVPSAFDDPDEPTLEERLTTLPDAATDPFSPLKARVEATIRLYRYNGEGAGLIDWAAAQTGLRDPLSHFSRHDLEERYRAFERARDAHLAQLMFKASREEPPLVARVREAAAASGHRGMQRAIAGR